jgi:uncharacterized membrane protein
MALDHANYFVAQAHSSGEYWGGSLPVYPTVWAFLTRLVTHLAAPGFFFLMGVGMVLLSLRRGEEGWNKAEIRRHFLLRGVLLILLQLLVINRAWELSLGGWGLTVYIGVLTALGGAMIVTAWLVDMRPAILLVLAAGPLIATELLTPSPDRWGHAFHPLLRLLLIPGGAQAFWVNYPLLPWLGVTLFGLAFGGWLILADKKTFHRALLIGVGALLLFALLRLGNGFGNIRSTAAGGWTAFLNLVKYPPSLTFVLLTIGVNLIVLRLFYFLEGNGRSSWDPLLVFGRTPLFFYTIHLFLYAGIGRLFTPRGTSLSIMVLYWLLGLALLYPACLGFGVWKRRQSSRSLIRLF